MASPSRYGFPRRALLAAALAALFLVPPAYALRIVDYNLLNYPGTTVTVRNAHFRTIMAPLGADVVVSQEVTSQAGVDSFRINVLNVLEPGQWASAPFINGNDTDNALFYKPAKVDFLGQWAWYPNPASLLRLVNCYRLRPVGYSAGAAELRIYSQHLKASTGYEAQRLAEATGIRDSMNAMPPGTHAILAGDFNIYGGNEPAFQKFLESQVDNDGRMYDPLGAPYSNWNNVGMATKHTQSPCLSGCPGGFSTGGLDDRFDMFLPTYVLNDGQGLDLIAGTYVPVGNDGLHYNVNIIDAPTIPEGAGYANALFNASDHLPIRVDLRLPSKIGVDLVSIDYGTVIVGAAAAQNLTITNTATAPADSLNYSFAAPAGFGAPSGGFALAATASAPAGISMNTATAGNLAGQLSIASDAPDNPTKLVGLSGTVLDHAQASLDSLVALTADTLDFGEHAAGEFGTLVAAVHDRGYNALRARLSVSAATITGGDGHFSIPGFSPTLVAGTAGRWNVQFADAGATADSTYQATLTFTSADEPLPGAAAQPDVSYILRARLTGGAVAVGGTPLPTATRLYPPMPNPLIGSSLVRFDLARAASVRLEVFDLTGRRVTDLASRAFEPGRYNLRWDGRDDAGSAVGPGLYFVRLSAAGLAAQTARLAVVR
ncbi:MAG: choice-of-anchor D domain-containing protein [Candidatus Eisenbacteria bacterium]|nr:choice-of-anchor D domain-containing protein [Candidatus Eisenbacteria bacterium]